MLDSVVATVHSTTYKDICVCQNPRIHTDETLNQLEQSVPGEISCATETHPCSSPLASMKTLSARMESIPNCQDSGSQCCEYPPNGAQHPAFIQLKKAAHTSETTSVEAFLVVQPRHWQIDPKALDHQRCPQHTSSTSNSVGFSEFHKRRCTLSEAQARSLSQPVSGLRNIMI